jgi:hypothetical protein
MSPLERGRTPFALKPGERLLLKGGFGGLFGWVWTCTALPFTVLGMGSLIVTDVVKDLMKGDVSGTCVALVFLPIVLLVGLWPWLRSGRYWLTTRRLVWAPYLGKRQSMSASEVADSAIGPPLLGVMTSSLRVRCVRCLTLRYISGLERLWGALWILDEFARLDLKPEHAGFEDAACLPATRQKGLSVVEGFLVLRPAYVAFLPSGSATHLGRRVAWDVAWMLVGVTWTEARAKPPFDLLVPLLCAHDPAEFDSRIANVVEDHGGLLWRLSQVEKISRDEHPFALREALVMRKGKVRLRAPLRAHDLPTVARLILEWTDGNPPPRKRPIARMVLLSAIVSVPALAGFIYWLVQGLDAVEPSVSVGGGALIVIAIVLWLITLANVFRRGLPEWSD